MSVRKIDINNDWTFGKGRNNYVSNVSEVSQNIKTRLQSFLGDCFFSLSDGIDWFNLLGSNLEEDLRLGVSTTIINTNNVIELTEVSLSKNSTREITIQYSASTSFGEIENETVTIGDTIDA